MIKIINRKITTSKTIEDIIAILKSKSISTKKKLNLTSTVNMIDNDKDYYAYQKNDLLYLSRIRRLGILRLLPKIIIIIPKENKKKQYQIRFALSTFIVSIYIIIALISNTYELILTQKFTQNFSSILVFFILFLAFILIEIKMYEQKFKKYLRK